MSADKDALSHFADDAKEILETAARRAEDAGLTGTATFLARRCPKIGTPKTLDKVAEALKTLKAAIVAEDRDVLRVLESVEGEPRMRLKASCAILEHVEIKIGRLIDTLPEAKGAEERAS